jgi:hypothetical protein
MFTLSFEGLCPYERRRSSQFAKAVELFCGLQFDADQIADPARGALVFGDDQFEWAGLSIEWLAIHGVGDDHFAGMKCRIRFGESNHSDVAVGPCSNDVST